MCIHLFTLLCSGISESGYSSYNQQAASGTSLKAIGASLQNCALPLNLSYQGNMKGLAYNDQTVPANSVIGGNLAP